MKRFFSHFFPAFLVLTLAACGGGGGSAGLPTGSTNPSNFLVNAPSDLTVSIGQSMTYSISGGKTPYAAVSTVPDVVRAVVDGQKLVVGGLSAGSAIVRVTPDGGGASHEISVTVVSNLKPIQIQAPSTINMVPGNSATYVVSGGTGPYRAVSSNTSVASVQMVSGSLKVDSVGIGTADVQVFDAVGSAAATLKVDVAAVALLDLFTNAPATLTMAPSSNRTFTVGGGLAPYSAQSSNTTSVSAAISGTVLSVGSLVDGAANVVVTDARGTKVTFTVTVSSGTPTALYTTAPSTLTMAPATEQNFTIGGGVAPYLVSSSNLQVVVASVAGSNLKLITPIAALGTASVVVTDATGKTVVIAVTASSGSLPLSLGSDKITIPVDLPEGARVRIIGGAPPYAVTPGIPGAVGTSIVPTTVGGITTYEVVITPRLVSVVDVTVVDAAGQSAKVEITTNAATPGIRIAPIALTISEKYVSQPTSFTVIGATGTYRVFSSDITRLTVPAGAQSGSTFDVTSTAALEVSEDLNITITVIDSANRIATSVVTVTNNP